MMRAEGGLGGREAAGPLTLKKALTPCQRESHLSLRPVTIATGCAQCTGEGGAKTMATKTDGEGCLSLKKQEPLLSASLLMTRVISLVLSASLCLTRQKGGNALEKRRGSSLVAMTAHHISLCAVSTSALQNTIRKFMLFTSAQICSARTKPLLARMWCKSKH